MKKRVLSSGLLLILFSLSVTAGGYFMNDTGEPVCGLRVEFSEPVTISGFGDILTAVEPLGESTTFTFSGGAVDPWGDHWIIWEPASASIVGEEWLMVIFSTEAFDPTEASIVSHTRHDEFLLVLPADTGGANVGVIRRTLSVEQIPFVVEYELVSQVIEGDVEWTSTYPEAPQSSQSSLGSSARFVYLSNRHNPVVGARLQVQGEWFEWTDPGISFPLHNMTSILLDAEAFLAGSNIESAEWSAANGDPHDGSTFPISSESAAHATLVSRWPNALNVTCVVRTSSGEVLESTAQALIYFQDGPPWEVRGSAMQFGAPMELDTWEIVLDELIPAFHDLGINSIATGISWYYGTPNGNGVFSIEPVYHYGPEWSIDDDPRGSTQKDEAIEYVFGRLDAEGIDARIHLRPVPNRNSPEAIECCGNSGFGSMEGFMQTDGYLYGDGSGYFNYLTNYIELFEEVGLDAVSLGTEQGQVESHGGSASQQFLREVVSEYREMGFSGLLTYSTAYAPCYNCNFDWTPVRGEIYEPSVCGVPWDSMDLVSVTFYPALAETNDDTTDVMYQSALSQIDEWLIPLHEVWNRPVFIWDMYPFAYDGCAVEPINDDYLTSRPYDPEEHRRYITAALRALAEATTWTEEPWLHGVTVGQYSAYPSSWPHREGLVLHQSKKSHLNDLYADPAFQDTVKAFFLDAPLAVSSSPKPHETRLKAHVAKTLAEMGYIWPTMSIADGGFVVDDFESDTPPTHIAGDWDYGCSEKNTPGSDPSFYCELSRVPYQGLGNVLKADFFFTLWLKVGAAAFIDASGFDGIELALWADAQMTVDVEVGLCTDPWKRSMLEGIDVATEPRRYRLPFSDFVEDAAGAIRGIPSWELADLCGIGFFPQPDVAGHPNVLYVDDVVLYRDTD